MPVFTVDYTITYSETHSTSVDAQTPEDAIDSIRNDAPNIRRRLTAGTGYTDVMIHVVERSEPDVLPRGRNGVHGGNQQPDSSLLYMR